MKRQCQTCGAAFEGRPNRLYCSTKCRREAEFEKRRAAGPVVTGDAGADFWENWPDLKFPDIQEEKIPTPDFVYKMIKAPHYLTGENWGYIWGYAGKMESQIEN